MNPWRQTFLTLTRDVLRFSLWLCVVVNGLMMGLFSIWLCYELLTHTRRWLAMKVFTGGW